MIYDTINENHFVDIRTDYICTYIIVILIIILLLHFEKKGVCLFGGWVCFDTGYNEINVYAYYSI